MTSALRVPRSLRPGKTMVLNYRQRKKNNRRTQLASDIRILRKNFSNSVCMNRERGLPEMENLFKRVHLDSISNTIQQLIGKNGSCTVFEIGHGWGNLLSDLSKHPAVRSNAARIRLIGLDVKRNPKKPFEQRVGNLLTKPFPKSDLIVSHWALGYSGHVGAVLKKTAAALNQNGIAVLHINHLRNGSGILIRDMNKLEKQLSTIKLPDCSMTLHRQDRRNGHDINIVLQKTG